MHDLTRRSMNSDFYTAPASTFQLTTSQGGRLSLFAYAFMASFFQLTTSQGGRRASSAYPADVTVLSTHDLTRRSTCLRMIFSTSSNLSTHDLTRRSTANGIHKEKQEDSFNSRPHKEVDSASHTLHAPPLPFNSRPHKEVDAGCSSD